MIEHDQAVERTELRESVMALARQMRRHRPDNGLTLSPDGGAGRGQPHRGDHPRRTRRTHARARAVPDRQHQRTGQPADWCRADADPTTAAGS